jgi:large subunit ribosomal protein L19e
MSQYTTANKQRKLAARILKCGIDKVWFDPSAAQKINAAVRRSDIMRLIKEGLIKKLKEERARKGEVRIKRKRAGSRKGPKYARLPKGKKTNWLKVVRPQRELLKKYKEKLPEGMYRKVYKLIKGNMFRSKAHLISYLRSHGVKIESDENADKSSTQKKA